MRMIFSRVSMKNRTDDMQTVIITTAGNMSQKTYTSLCDGFREKLGEVNFVQKTDPSLIGGFIANIGGEIYDMSLSAQLSKMKSCVIE